MALSPKGPFPAMAALTLSAVFLAASLERVLEANIDTVTGDPADQAVLAWGRAFFIASLVAGFAAVALLMMQPKRRVPLLEIPPELPIAPAVGLVALARDFVLRLRRVLLLAGGILLVGGLGLVASASLVADGTHTSPFEIPGKVWGVHFHFWQVQVSTWAFAQLAIALTIWGSEYRWVRDLQAKWRSAPPGV